MWPLNWIQIAGGAIVAFVISYCLHTVDLWWIEAGHAKELSDQKTTLIAECETDKTITKEASNDYQKKLSDTQRQLDDLKRVRPARCVPVSTPRPAAGCDGAAGNEKPSGTDGGISSTALLDFAGEAEKYRIQLISCQDFITKTWAAKGQ